MASLEEIQARAARLKAMTAAVEGVGTDSTAEPPDRQGEVPPTAPVTRADLHEAIASATNTDIPDIETQAAALEQEGGRTLSESARGVLRGMRGKFARISGIMRGLPPDERAAIQAAVLNPDEDRKVPDTSAAREIKTILDAIEAAANSADLPPHMRRHSKAMALRPVGETGKIVLEGGILTLVANGLLSAFGIVVTPYSVAHGLTYVLATGGVGLMNITTISGRVLRPAAEGSLKPLVQNPAKHRGFSLLHAGSSTLRLALLGVSVTAGIGMAEKAIQQTSVSSRIAGGISAPLDAFAAKKAKFEKQLAAFAKVPAKILEIAGKIEEGKLAGSPASAVAVTERPTSENTELLAARKRLADAEKKLAAKQTEARAKAVEAARADLAKVEAGAIGHAEVHTAGGNYAAWSSPEKTQMINELRTAFTDAGLDPSLADSIKFAEPEKLGYGIAAKLKRAIRTGDTTDLPPLQSYPADAVQKLTALVGPKATTAEYVVAIRAKMGLDDKMTIDTKMSRIVHEFFALPIFSDVNTNWDKAQRFSGMIKHQGDDVVATGERAFLHGAEPIGPETVVPYAKAIIAARGEVDKAAQEHLIGKINEVFGTMQSALTIAGASVTLVTPEVHFDTSDIESLEKYLASLITEKAKGTVTTEATNSAINAMVEKFVPGGKKWEETKRWLSIHLLQSNGYYVKLEGEKIHIYESATAGAAGTEGADLSIINGVSKYYREWIDYLSGKGPTTEWKFPRPELEKKPNKDLGAEVRPQLQDLADERKRLIVTEPEVQAAPIDPRVLSDEELGRMLKEQVETQHALGQKPIIVSPEIWEAMKRGVPPPTAEGVDMSKWRELGESATQKILAEYESAAAWRGITYLGGGVGTLILGIMLLSLYPVYRLNKKLREAAPDFEKGLDEAEKTITEALDTVNDTFAGIPILNALPRMDFTTLHAALRMAAEEAHPAEISEHPSTGTQIWHTVKEAFSSGPYAYRVEQIMSFTDLIEKLQNSKAMQRSLSDIIAPGATRAESKVKKLPVLPDTTGDALQDMRAQIGEMNTATAEIFRNAARGNLGFRIAVIQAQLDTLVSMDKMETDSARKSAIAEEITRLSRDKAALDPILKRLNSDDLYARMAITHKTPWSFGPRAKAQDRASSPPTILIPADLLVNRRYSVPHGIIDDVRSRIDAAVPPPEPAIA